MHNVHEPYNYHHLGTLLKDQDSKNSLLSPSVPSKMKNLEYKTYVERKKKNKREPKILLRPCYSIEIENNIDF